MNSAEAYALVCLAAGLLACEGGAGQPTATAEPISDGSGSAATPSGKSAECSALISVVNNGLAGLEANQKDAKSDTSPSAELRAMATAMNKAALTASQLALDTPELKAFAARYKTMSTAVATHATAVADASEKKDLDKLQAARKELNETLKLEDPLIDEVNAFCK